MSWRTDDGPFTYFAHEVDGHLCGGWYRRLPDQRLEVIARTLAHVTAIGVEPIEAAARRVLTAMIRGDELP